MIWVTVLEVDDRPVFGDHAVDDSVCPKMADARAVVSDRNLKSRLSGVTVGQGISITFVGIEKVRVFESRQVKTPGQDGRKRRKIQRNQKTPEKEGA